MLCVVSSDQYTDVMRFLDLLVARGWRKGQIARHLGVDPSTVSHWLHRNSRPYPLKLILMATLDLLKEPVPGPEKGARRAKHHSESQLG